MHLTDLKARSAKPTASSYKLKDGAGMYLLVTAKGARYWRLDYHFGGKRKTLALGIYPVTSLAAARKLRDEARSVLAKGLDPTTEKKKRVAANGNSFEAVAREWIEKKRKRLAPRYSALLLARLAGDVFPSIGHCPMEQIGALDLLPVLQKVEKRGALETARRLRQTCGQIFRYAVATGKAMRDPTPDLKEALLPAGRKQGRKAVASSQLVKFMSDLSQYDGEVRTRLALHFIVLTFVRTKELIEARWREFEALDGADPLWRIPPERMKMKTEHLVPLAPQAVALLRELRSLPGYELSPYLFPSASRHGHMSNNTMLYAMYRMGYHGRATVHGFRALASTTLNEAGFHPDLIEKQLAHEERSNSRKAYNHAQYLERRREMMTYWANVVEGGNVIRLKLA